jgi:hypothetical protein
MLGAILYINFMHVFNNSAGVCDMETKIESTNGMNRELAS